LKGTSPIRVNSRAFAVQLSWLRLCRDGLRSAAPTGLCRPVCLRRLACSEACDSNFPFGRQACTRVHTVCAGPCLSRALPARLGGHAAWWSPVSSVTGARLRNRSGYPVISRAAVSTRRKALSMPPAVESPSTRRPDSEEPESPEGWRFHRAGWSECCPPPSGCLLWSPMRGNTLSRRVGRESNPRLSAPWADALPTELPVAERAGIEPAMATRLPGAPCAFFPILTTRDSEPVHGTRPANFTEAMGAPRRRSRGVSNRKLPEGGKPPTGVRVPSGVAVPMGDLVSTLVAAPRLTARGQRLVKGNCRAKR
jgi:hypothetical protein